MFETEYLVAWTVFLLAGISCCFIWWRITAHLEHGGWRELARGFAIVVVFTPWYTSTSNEHLAPAVVVLLMDLLVEGAKSGMQGGFALLFSTFTMLMVLLFRALWLKRVRSDGR